MSNDENEPCSENGWTFKDVKKFEHIWGEFDFPTPPAFFQKVALEMSWKTMKAIKLHYQLLLRDLRIIKNSDVETICDETGGQVFKICDEQVDSQSEKQAENNKGKGIDNE